jgi:hypothetical protein
MASDAGIIVSATEVRIAVSSADKNAGRDDRSISFEDHSPAQAGKAIIPAEAIVRVLIVFRLFILDIAAIFRVPVLSPENVDHQQREGLLLKVMKQSCPSATLIISEHTLTINCKVAALCEAIT